MKLIDADALLGIVKQHHDFFSGAMLQADKARRDELSQVMADIVNAPAIDAIPVKWLREWQDEVGTINEWWPIIERIITVWREEQGVE